MCYITPKGALRWVGCRKSPQHIQNFEIQTASNGSFNTTAHAASHCCANHMHALVSYCIGLETQVQCTGQQTPVRCTCRRVLLLSQPRGAHPAPRGTPTPGIQGSVAAVPRARAAAAVPRARHCCCPSCSRRCCCCPRARAAAAALPERTSAGANQRRNERAPERTSQRQSEPARANQRRSEPAPERTRANQPEQPS